MLSKLFFVAVLACQFLGVASYTHAHEPLPCTGCPTTR